MIKNLNVRPETEIYLEENIRVTKLIDISLGNEFLHLTSKAKINKWDYVKLKKLVFSKGNCEQNEKAKYEMAETICKLHI